MDSEKATLTVLARLAARVPEQAVLLEQALSGRLLALLETAVAVATETPGPIDLALCAALERADIDAALVRQQLPTAGDGLTRCRQWALRTAAMSTMGIERAHLLTELAEDYSTTGDHEQAFDAAEAAQAELEAGDAPSPSELLASLAQIHFDLGRTAEALALALQTAETQRSEDADALSFASNQQLLAILHERNGNQELAQDARHEAIAELEVNVATLPLTAQKDRAVQRGLIGTLHLQADAPGEAIPHLQAAVADLRELAADQPGTYRAVLASDLFQLSEALEVTEKLEESVAALREAISTHRELTQLGDARAGEELAIMLSSLANSLARLGHIDQAARAAEEALSLTERYGTAPYMEEHTAFLNAMLAELGAFGS